MLDCSPFTGKFGHYHAGKNAPSYWFRNKPFLVDSGCSSYEDPLFAQWYKQSQAHSSLLVDGQGDGEVVGLYECVSWASVDYDGWSKDNDSLVFTATLTSNAKGWENVIWTRQLRVEQKGIMTIRDTVSSQEPKELKFIYNFHPDVDAALGQSVHLKNQGICLALNLDTSLDADSDIKIDLSKGKCFLNGAHHSNNRLEISLKVQNRQELISTFYPIDERQMSET